MNTWILLGRALFNCRMTAKPERSVDKNHPAIRGSVKTKPDEPIPAGQMDSDTGKRAA